MTMFALAFLCLTPTGCAYIEQSISANKLGLGSPAIEQMLSLMEQRLILMHEVARWKWQAKQPITDPVREQALLARVVAQGQRLGLPTQWVRSFFVAQMDAGKRIQQADFEQWQANPSIKPSSIKDLALIRHDIDDLNTRLLKSLATVLQSPIASTDIGLSAQQHLLAAGIDKHISAVAAMPFYAIPSKTSP